MFIRIARVLLLVTLVAASANAQLFGVRNPGDGGRQVVSIDPASAAITAISASISPPLPSASAVAALDAEGDRYFFVATPTGETDSRLYAVDTQTGAVLGSPTITGSASAPFLALGYDADDDVLYGLRNPGDSGAQVVMLDPATAAITPVSASLSAPLGMSSGVAAIDSDGDRFFFIATPNSETDARVFTVDLNGGALVTSPTIPGSASAFFMGLEYDEDEDVLYGARNPGDGGRQVVSVDPTTGAVTAISASIFPPFSSSSGIVALDAGGNRFFLIGTALGDTDSRLVTVHTASGAILSSPLISGSASAFFQDLAFAPAPPSGPLTVTIDIKPGSSRNPINLRSRGVIPVAILTTPTFDATTVDPATVRFGPGLAEEIHGRGHVDDVDGDGDDDLVLHFASRDAEIPCGATSATLTGETFSAQAIEGSDVVKTLCK
jgi:outer membrane protein assembly factor BamB